MHRVCWSRSLSLCMYVCVNARIGSPPFTASNTQSIDAKRLYGAMSAGHCSTFLRVRVCVCVVRVVCSRGNCSNVCAGRAFVIKSESESV